MTSTGTEGTMISHYRNGEPFTIISFFTENYTHEIVRLWKSVMRYELPYCFEKVKPKPTWVETVSYKPKFILKKLEEYKAPVIWIDADAQVIRRPDLFYELDDYDLAYYTRNRDGYVELLSGTMYLNYNQQVLTLVEQWAELAEQWAKSNVWEQKILQELEPKTKLRVFDFPVGYCQIFDQQDMLQEPGVVVHFQASRKVKLEERYVRF